MGSMARSMRRRRGRECKVTVAQDGSRTIPLNAEARDALQRQMARFVEKFGREPKPDEPIFFDENADTPQPSQVTLEPLYALMNEQGFDPALIHASRMTDRIVTAENEQYLTDAELAEWDAAYKEGRRMHRKGGPCKCISLRVKLGVL